MTTAKGSELETEIVRVIPGPGGEACVVRVRVPDDWLYVRGHFPGFPIVPGIAQLLTMVVGPARRVWPDLPAPRGLRRVKFLRPIRPGEEVIATLKRTDAGLRFALAVAGAPCTAGTVALGEDGA